MKINLLTPGYSVSAQLCEADFATLKAEGFKTVICNRPDEEIEPPLHAKFMHAEAARLGIALIYNPVSSRGFTMPNVDTQAEAIDNAEKPILAYCHTGTRSTVCWALVHANRLPVDEIVTTAAKAGYDIGKLRPQLEAMAEEEA